MRKKRTNKALITFIKSPSLGNAKTRIAKVAGGEAAMQIYRQLLAITRDVVLNVDCSRLLYYAQYIDHHDEWSSDHFNKYIQSEGDLGERMKSAFEEAFKLHNQVIIIGSDCPYIDHHIIESAFDSLDRYDVVIGPSNDGGYYLIGMAKPYFSLFDNMPWSTTALFDLTIDKCKQEKYSYHLCPTLSDIDYIEDWNAYLDYVHSDNG